MEVPYERNQSDLNSFQIILFEGTNAIQVNYLNVVSRGISDNTFNFTTAGIENSTGAIGLKYPLFDTAGRYTNTYVRYMPQQTNRAPEANAGADKSVEEGSKATLDGSGSSDPDAGDALTYKWTQIDGLVVSLSSSTVAKP
ncbi:MAG: hypothetical protein JW884_07565, partial [Deltaproteobacteria bacterium]|nr:hypothetical protein [Deltaproteobacteria bacterium]